MIYQVDGRLLGVAMLAEHARDRVDEYLLWNLAWGLGFRVWGSGFGVQGLGFGVWGLGFGVLGLGFGFWVLGFGV